MSWALTQARINLAAERKRQPPHDEKERPAITHFEPADLGYLKTLKATYAAAGLMPPGTRTNGRISVAMLKRAKAVKLRMDELLKPKKRGNRPANQ